MVTAPLTSYEQVKHGLDDQVQHLGMLVGALVGQVSWPQYSPIVQKRWLGECLGVGDPIDALAHLRESMCCGGDEQHPLRPECEHGLLPLERWRDDAAPRRVCASFWLPIH